jgi:hypothetical protein
MNAYRTWITRLIAVTILLGSATNVRADPVLAGYDLWITPPGGAIENFGSGVPPIPADFFNPGSDPFLGTIQFTGQPIGTYEGQPTGNADTVVQRLADANLPLIPSSDVIPIQLVELSLTSIEPIVVTYNGGQNPQSWDVTVTLSPAPSTGTMQINHTNVDGGTYGASINVCPVFTFTEVGVPGNIRTIDYCIQVNPAGRNINVNGAPWVHVIQQPQVSPLSGPNFTPNGPTQHNGPHPIALPIETSSSVAVPSLGGWALLACGLVLFAVGAVVLRRRQACASKA